MTDDQQQNGSPTTGHNVAEVLATIQKCNTEAYALQCEIDDAVEKHVKPLKNKLTKLFRTTKADTTVPIGVLKAHYKLFEMAQDAKGDEDGGGATLDGMRLAFEALQVGNQLDWLDAVAVQHRPGSAPDFVDDMETQEPG